MAREAMRTGDREVTGKVEFSVVVPVYSSEATLQALVGRIGDVFRRLGRSYEVVLTDDGSRDGSWAVIEGLYARVAGYR
jgi:glycosyltransferase involved in cell wall biosynthesis